MNTFSPSQPELDRRMAAFTALLISLYFSLLISACVLFPEFVFNNPWFSLLTALAFLWLFIGFRVIIAGFFRIYQKTKVLVTDTHLERHAPKYHDRFLLQDIRKMSVKRTTRNSIREIGIWFTSGQNIYLDGLANFEQMRTILMNANPTLAVTESRERLDFDHLVFYPLLGACVGLAVTAAIKFTVNLYPPHVRLMSVVFAAYILALGAYFIFTKPLAKRYGEKYHSADYLCGLMMVAASVVMLVKLFL